MNSWEDKQSLILIQLKHGKIDEEKAEALRKEYQALLSDEDIVSYFSYLIRVNNLISDMQKAVFKDVTDILA